MSTEATTIDTGSRPTAQRRLLGVDAARGLALIGMMSIHVTPHFTDDGESSLAYVLASGRASALFAMLAGVGLALAYGRRSPLRGRNLGGAAAAVTTRGAVLILVGLFLGGLDSGAAVILVNYGLLFVLAIPFLSLGARTLLPLAATWAVVVPIVSHIVREDMPLSTYNNINPESFNDLGGLVRELFLTGYYPVLPWTAYLLAGMGIGRLALNSARVAAWLFGGGVVLATATWLVSSWLLESRALDEILTAGSGGHPVSTPPEFAGAGDVLASSFYGTTPTTSPWWLATASPHTATPFDLLHTIGSSMAVLGAMLLLARFVGRYVVWPLSAIGSMTFTLYSMHIVLLTAGLNGETDYALLWNVLIAFAVAMPWRGFIGRGPLEAMTAALSGAARAAVRPISR